MDKDGYWSIYAGKTANFGERQTAPIANTNSTQPRYPRSPHYRFAQKDVRTVRICLLRQVEQQERRFLEKAFILLLGTYHPGVTKTQGTSYDALGFQETLSARRDALAFTSYATAIFNRNGWDFLCAAIVKA